MDRRSLFLSAASLLITRVAGCAQPRPSPDASPPEKDLPPVPPIEARFWTVVAGTLPAADEPRLQLAALTAALDAMTADEIIVYERGFTAAMARSYTWSLWGAAYVAHGGASDDGFEYFRCWLVSRGRAAFETVLATPDALADVIPPWRRSPVEFEDFAYVAREVWSRKTGTAQMPEAAAMAYPDNPKGEPFKEDRGWLAERYPKLWKRFGILPLF